jgi:hypothetical protein
MRLACESAEMRSIVDFLELNKIRFKIDFRGWLGKKTLYDINLPTEKDEFVFKLKYGNVIGRL